MALEPSPERENSAAGFSVNASCGIEDTHQQMSVDGRAAEALAAGTKAMQEAQRTG